LYIPGHIPGAAAPSEALDPAGGLCRLKFMKKPIFLCRNLAKQFLNEFSDVASTACLSS